MGIKNGSVGAFPSNFVREIFVAPKGASAGYVEVALLLIFILSAPLNVFPGS